MSAASAASRRSCWSRPPRVVCWVEETDGREEVALVKGGDELLEGITWRHRLDLRHNG